MEQLRVLFSNYLINVGFLSWLSAQVLKTILVYISTDHFVPERLVGAGGMPSAHSALVCSITVGMARKVGFASPEFALTLAFAGVVMYDAMGVRRAAGEHAKVLNQMIFNLKNQQNIFEGLTLSDDIDLPPGEELLHSLEERTDGSCELPTDKILKEFLGHTPLEVMGGALLGILVAMILPPF